MRSNKTIALAIAQTLGANPDAFLMATAIGLDHVSVVARRFHPNPAVLRTCNAIANWKVQVGHELVSLLEDFPIAPLWFKAMVPRNKAHRPEVAALLAQDGLAVEVVADVAAQVWGKLAINAAINPLTALLTFFSLIGYAVIYTAWLKRATPQNIVIGGLFGAAPPLFGWTAVTGVVEPGGVLLVWTGFDVDLGGNQTPEAITMMRLCDAFIPAAAA